MAYGLQANVALPGADNPDRVFASVAGWSGRNDILSYGAERQTPSMRQKEKLWIEPKHRYDDHRFPESSEEFRLADGRPLWYALLSDPNVLVMNAADANRARSRLRDLFRVEPDLVRKCIGGSLEEARERFDQIPVEE